MITSFEQLEHTGQKMRASQASMQERVGLRKGSLLQRTLENKRLLGVMTRNEPRLNRPEPRNGWPNGKVLYATPSSSIFQTFRIHGLPGISYRLSRRSLRFSPKPGATPSRRKPS